MIYPIQHNTLDEAITAMVDTQAEAREQHAARSAAIRRMLKDAKRGSHACPGGYFGACGKPISKNVSHCWSCAVRLRGRVEPVENWLENAA